VSSTFCKDSGSSLKACPEALDFPQWVVLDMDSTEVPGTAGRKTACTGIHRDQPGDRHPSSGADLQQARNGGRLVKHARHYRLMLAESHLTRRLFGGMVRRIKALPVPAG
jgi:hypothetical protein